MTNRELAALIGLGLSEPLFALDALVELAALASRPSLVDTGEALREARELLAMVPAQELPVQRHLDAIAKIDAALAAHPKPEEG